MEFFDEFEILGGIIPNMIGLAFFCGVIIYFYQTRNQKSDEKKNHLLLIQMILFTKAQILME